MKAGWLFVLLTLMSTTGLAQQDDNGEPIVTDTSEVVEVQEVKYVTDKLRLSLYKSADSNSGVMKLLISGDELDILEKTGPYSKVRTRGGLTGWVKNGFLVSTKTANLLLDEEQQKNRELQAQIERYADTEKLVQDYEDSIQKMDTDLVTLNQQLEQARVEKDQLIVTNGELSQQLQQIEKPSSQPAAINLIPLAVQYWYVIVGVCLVLLLCGILIGRSIVEARVKRRFQGVKVW